MPIAELLNNARFLTNQQGEQTDVLLSIETWNSLLSLVEQLEQDDPDQGLSLRSELEKQLLTIRDRQASGQRGIPAADVAARYGMTWQ
jgi:hypothetical protein